MRLHRKAIEYVHSTVTPADVALLVSIDEGLTWTDLPVEDGTARILIAGPAAVSPPGEALVIPSNVNLLVKATDDPEHPIRKWGSITLWG